jgi:lysozyme family protein
MADFKKWVKRRLKIEAGYQCWVNDNGNYTGGEKGKGKLIGTNRGITAPELCAYLGREATVDDMKALTVEVAELIYKHNYWDPMRGDEFEFYEPAETTADQCVNMGVRQGITNIQRSANIKATGVMDNYTMNVLNNKIAAPL